MSLRDSLRLGEMRPRWATHLVPPLAALMRFHAARCAGFRPGNHPHTGWRPWLFLFARCTGCGIVRTSLGRDSSTTWKRAQSCLTAPLLSAC